MCIVTDVDALIGGGVADSADKLAGVLSTSAAREKRSHGESQVIHSAFTLRDNLTAHSQQSMIHCCRLS